MMDATVMIFSQNGNWVCRLMYDVCVHGSRSGAGSRLEIVSATEEDHGEYGCRAENSIGFLETITNIKIVSGSTPIFTHDHTNLTHRCGFGIQCLHSYFITFGFYEM